MEVLITFAILVLITFAILVLIGLAVKEVLRRRKAKQEQGQPNSGGGRPSDPRPPTHEK